ncbi:MAG: phosphate acyltransferase PlsX [Chloroflexi bacterium]|nr:phosphate acyltransferase PlsX [Chloroflexota bacterium]
MRIALDAMGSDHFPVPDVSGAVQAAREWGDTIYLVGDPGRIRQELGQHDTTGLKLEVVPARDVITMTDKPGVVGEAKPDSSMHVGMNLVKDGRADAFVTAGNTGAAMAIATLYTLRRIQGVKRPALSSIVRVGDRSVILLDIGANADTKPEWLGQFALMGKIYAQNALGISSPRIALLSNGEEEEKGNALIREAQTVIKQLNVNFVGNVEPKDVLRGQADVVVSDGFVGNIAIKSFEAIAGTMFDLIRTEIKRDPLSTLGGLLARRAFRRVYKQIDPFEVGGAPLLGVNGVVIIGHGRSNAKAIKNAIRQARLAVSGQIIDRIQTGLRQQTGVSASVSGLENQSNKG